MPTITSSQTASFTIDAFGSIAVVVNGQGSLNATSRAQNLKSNVVVSVLQSKVYGPFGVPMDVVISCSDGSITYTVTDGYGAGTGSGGYLGSGNGSDLTAMTLSGSDITHYTAGAKFVITRDGDNIPTSIDIDGGSTGISSVLTRVGSTNYFVVSSGAKFVGGALAMTLAQMRALEAVVVATSTTLESGFRVFVTNVGSMTDAAGNTTVPGATARWAGGLFLWVEPVIYRIDEPVVWQNSGSPSGSLMALTLPAGVMGKFSSLRNSLFIPFAASGVNTKTISWRANGTSFLVGSALAANIRYIAWRKAIRNAGALNAQDYARNSDNDTITSSTGAHLTSAINTASTPIEIDVQIQFAGANSADIATLTRHVVLVSDDQTMS
jgi:hypothetical protein